MIGRDKVECPLDLVLKARRNRALKTVVINAVHPVVMESVRDAVEAGVIEPVLVGQPGAVAAAAAEVGFDIGGYEVVAADGEEGSAAKGAALAGSGGAEAVMKGHLHTDIFMRALLQRDAGLRVGRPFAHVFHMTVPGREGALLISDAALNPAPDLELKKTILTNCAAVARALGVARPKLALLSATEVPSERIPSSVDAATLAEWAPNNLPDADVAGPLALDLALSEDAARVKGIDSPVAGRADALIVPEIVAGNALFKLMVQMRGACAAGVVLGAKVPIMLTSRADPPAARLASAALASVVRDL